MGNRLTKIYTRTGDAGTTGKADGSRVDKDDALIHAQGDVDELNSFVGLLVSRIDNVELCGLLNHVQHDLFNIGAELSISQQYINGDDVSFLEHTLDHYNAALPPLKEFILPGGGEAAAVCHVARAVCRRAERSLVTLDKEQAVGADMLAYINRLSDLLFVLARVITREAGEQETCWKHKTNE
ncbi:MAG: cob(I)yrinic acid a,c-diamide adenosyltransferase [Thiotrichales bacterium]|nr:MAG: cob(I)yrinic acid a,c-diamide adenosyltransferase [Thiotrichales bacterium]